MDQDLFMKALHFHGPVLLQTILGDMPEVKGEVESEKMAMCKFIKRKLNTLFEPSENDTTKKIEYPIPFVPIEIFRDLSVSERRDLFFKTLVRGNVLMLRVINDTLPNDYKLLVLCQQDCIMKLDDLSLVMYLPKLQEELNLAGGKLESHDLMRAAVCSCDIDSRKLYVTLDSSIFEEGNIKLGKITEAELPPYIGTGGEFGSSFVEYLHSNPAFKNPNWANALYSDLNLEEMHLYSFIDCVDGKVFNEESYGSNLKKKQNFCLAHEQYEKACQWYESGNFTEAFLCLNSALKLYPQHVDALVLRGTMYSNTNNLRKAFVDVDEALKYDPNHEKACKQMAILLVSGGRLHLEKNRLNKAQQSLDAALNLDSTNKDAIAALEELKLKRQAGVADKSNKDKDGKSRIWSSSSESSTSKKDDSRVSLESQTRVFLRQFQEFSLKRNRIRKNNKKKVFGPPSIPPPSKPKPVPKGQIQTIITR